VRLFTYLVGSAIFATIASVVWLLIALQCGMGPDSPVACNERADQQAHLFALGSITVFLILSFFFWRRRGAGAQ